jgi:hypothetical protein
MTLSTKNNSKTLVGEKKVRASRKVSTIKEEIKEELKEKIKEEPPHSSEEVKVDPVSKEEEPVSMEEEPVLEQVLEILEVPLVDFEAGANACFESSLVEIACPPCEELVEPIVLAKKCGKVKPQVNENGDYLNPITNRYVKFGSSNFKKLLNAGVIKPVGLGV